MKPVLIDKVSTRGPEFHVKGKKKKNDDNSQVSDLSSEWLAEPFLEMGTVEKAEMMRLERGGENSSRCSRLGIRSTGF